MINSNEVDEEKIPTKIKKLDLMEFRSRNKEQYCADIVVKMKTSGEKII